MGAVRQQKHDPFNGGDLIRRSGARVYAADSKETPNTFLEQEDSAFPGVECFEAHFLYGKDWSRVLFKTCWKIWKYNRWL